MQFKHILVTGGEGFVGKYLIPALQQAAPDSILTMTRRSEGSGTTSAAQDRHSGPSTWVTLDIANPDPTDHLVKTARPDLVIHLAAQSALEAGTSAAQTWSTNVGGTMALATAVARHTPNATVLNISSAEVYGQSFDEGPAQETTALHPTSVYGRTKAAAEAAFSDILPLSARLICARPFNHTGAGQSERFIVPAFAAQIARIERGEQQPVIKVGNLSSQRDFLDVRDVVAAYLALISHSPALPQRSIFNIASGKAIQMSDILARLLAMTTVPIDVETDPGKFRSSDIACALGDASALRAATGWAPQSDMDLILHHVLTDKRKEMRA